MLLIDEKQDLTFTRRRKKIPIPITNKISSSRISDELRVLKVKKRRVIHFEKSSNNCKKLAKNKKLFKFGLKKSIFHLIIPGHIL